MNHTWLTFPDGEKVKLDHGESALVSDRLQRKLEQFHGLKARPVCGCTYQEQPVEVVIRHLHTGRYTVACFPMAGHHHFPNCDFHATNIAQSNSKTYDEGVIKDNLDGTMSIKISGGLKIGDQDRLVATKRPDPNLPISPRTGSSRSSMTLLGLGHLLWEEAQLNRWPDRHGGERLIWRAVQALTLASEAIRSDGVRLADRLCIVLPEATTQNKVTMTRVTRAEGDDYRWVVIAAIKAIEPEKYGTNSFVLDGFGGIPLYLRAKPEKIDHWMNAAPYATRILQTLPDRRVERVIGIFTMKPPRRPEGKDYLTGEIDRGAFMETSLDLVPVASSYERHVAEKLIEQGRKFAKPLRYDAGVDKVLADFELLDAGDRPVPMEIYGMEDADYLLRRKEKEAYYDQVYGPGNTWSWVAAGPGRQPMPHFPPKRV